MKLRPRFTLRWLMLLVALVAIGIGATIELLRRSQKFSRLADYHLLASAGLHHAGDSPSIARTFEYRLALVKKYRHLARYPWLPVEPDPPEPE